MGVNTPSLKLTSTEKDLVRKTSSYNQCNEPYVGNREKYQLQGRQKPRELKQKELPTFQPSKQLQVSFDKP